MLARWGLRVARRTTPEGQERQSGMVVQSKSLSLYSRRRAHEVPNNLMRARMDGQRGSPSSGADPGCWSWGRKFVSFIFLVTNEDAA